MALFFGTSSLVLWSNYTKFKLGGITFLEGIILFCSFICTFQPIVASWRAVIGLLIMAFGNAEKSRTALVVFMRNEDPSSIFDHVLEMHKSLSQIGRLQRFRFVLLSDTTLPEVMCMEDEGFARIKDDIGIGTYQTPFYRRRSKNIGFKGGNISRVENPGASGVRVRVLSQWFIFRLLPKIAAFLTIVTNPPEMKRYGGIFHFVTSVVLEYVITSIVSTAATVSMTLFFSGLLRGTSIKWDAQNRDRLGLSWRQIFRVFWVENLIGLGIIWLIITQDTSHRLLPLAISLFLLVPITVLTASPRLSYLIIRLRLFTTPDENPVSPVLSRLVALGIITIYKDKAKTMGKAL
ncbi:Glucans biosynthesis glucosyltransferase H [Fusarium acutatum]|uniref:Glucans biosynthesis glucosyltransferase H n=1 Tax=Fusarium acutatum TaxID=78861 RepID=A0A8H4NMN7_9HYPO|nr:Glucans biosynthesis glucosyltransferase H [Fusarium acutatum]